MGKRGRLKEVEEKGETDIYEKIFQNFGGSLEGLGENLEQSGTKGYALYGNSPDNIKSLRVKLSAHIVRHSLLQLYIYIRARVLYNVARLHWSRPFILDWENHSLFGARALELEQKGRGRASSQRSERLMTMAKMDVLKALRALAELGIELTDEQTEALEEFKSAAFMAEAVKVFEKKATGDAEQWATEMFDFAASIADGIEGATVGRGRGEVFERMFRIETPSGSLKVSLTVGTESE